ncbi:MAG TPA: heterodisulfide reductase-related iron-sulfur binding cluster [Candidatus Saccharimonadales bacterium]|nr:heterodisulfide reductase-related iron-sulfur binding cluster [Candidatus Saccharimonadales bacterium]
MSAPPPEPRPPAPAATGWFDLVEPPDRDQLHSCIHCGLCLAACPTYRELKLEPDSPRGRLYLMRALHEGRIDPAAGVRAHLDLCLVCRACETACPSGVPFGELMGAVRGQLERRLPRRGLARWAQDRVFRGLLPSRRKLSLFTGALRLYQLTGLRALVRGTRATRLLPAALRAAEGLLPDVPGGPRRLPARVAAAVEPPRARVAFLVTCVNRALFPDVNRATLGLLSKAGAEVVIPRRQTCCGALHEHAGRRSEAQALARRNIAAVEAAGPVDFVVTSAAGCGAALREYGHWLRHDPEWAARAERLAGMARDTLEVLAELGLPEPARPGGGSAAATVAVHDPCHLAHAQKVRAAPRALLRAAGYQLVDLEDSDFCCGSAGIYNLLQPSMALRQLERKLECVRRAGAHFVVAANPGCLLYMQQGARQARIPARVVHPLTLLARAHGVRE